MDGRLDSLLRPCRRKFGMSGKGTRRLLREGRSGMAGADQDEFAARPRSGISHAQI